jgi:hypothetical protein
VENSETNVNENTLKEAMEQPAFQKAYRSIVSGLRKLEGRLEVRRAQLADLRPSSLYDIFKSKDPAKFAELTVETAARALIPGAGDRPVHPELLFAVHRELIEDADHFIADSRAHRVSTKFYVRSQNDVDDLVRVRQWVRDSAPQIDSFVSKAKHISALAEANPPSSSAPMLERYKGPLPSFNEDDMTIIRLLRSSVKVTRLVQEYSSDAVSAIIFKALGHPYTWEGSKWSPAVEALRRIGVFAPWENLPAHDETLGLANWDREGHLIVNESVVPPNKTPPVKSPKGKEATAVMPKKYSEHSLYPDDPLESVRHDFGSMPVYVVDDLGAQELDDGVSIEPAPPSRPGSSSMTTWWVHAHVADPTARLHHRHPISFLARRRVSSAYLPERTWSMLPDWFLASAGRGLTAGTTEPQNVLTFSARVDEDGWILETKVRAGIVRNVITATYDRVDEIIGTSQHPSPLLLDTGHTTFAADRDDDSRGLPTRVLSKLDDPSDIEAVLTLNKVGRALGRARARDGGLYWNVPEPNLSVHAPSLVHNFTQTSSPELFTGLPRISLSASTFAEASPAHRVISEIMVLAGRVAARFTKERGIPSLYRGQEPPAGGLAAFDELHKLKNEYGQLEASDVESRSIKFAPGYVSIEPAKHCVMGITDDFGYVRATSPLRRYGDMVVHWQIKSALLPSSHPLGGKPPPFSRDELVKIALQTEPVAKAAKNVGKRATMSWALYLIKHKLGLVGGGSKPTMTLDEQELLETLEGVVIREPQKVAVAKLDRYMIRLPVFGLQGVLQVPDGEQGLEVGEVVPVRFGYFSLDHYPSFTLERRQV